jgi:mutator protein MutT
LLDVAIFERRKPEAIRAGTSSALQFSRVILKPQMLKDLIGALWRRTPKGLRRWTVRVSHPRFGVTAGAIVTDAAGRVLLLKHRFRPGAGWGMPGGFMEEGEQPEEALRRELREEIGLEVQQVKLFATRAFLEPKQVEIVFLCQAVGDPDVLGFEIQKAAWFSPEDLPKELPEDQAQLIKRALRDGASVQD